MYNNHPLGFVGFSGCFGQRERLNSPLPVNRFRGWPTPAVVPPSLPGCPHENRENCPSLSAVGRRMRTVRRTAHDHNNYPLSERASFRHLLGFSGKAVANTRCHESINCRRNVRGLWWDFPTPGGKGTRLGRVRAAAIRLKHACPYPTSQRKVCSRLTMATPPTGGRHRRILSPPSNCVSGSAHPLSVGKSCEASSSSAC